MLLRKNFLWVLILNVLTLGFFTFYIGKKLKVYDKNAWYMKWYYWVLSFVFGIIPGLIMFLIFYIEVGNLVSEKLFVPLSEVYALPYSWLLCVIIPVIGWALFFVMIFYTHFWYILYLKRGYGEKYIDL